MLLSLVLTYHRSSPWLCTQLQGRQICSNGVLECTGGDGVRDGINVALDSLVLSDGLDAAPDNLPVGGRAGNPVHLNLEGTLLQRVAPATAEATLLFALGGVERGESIHGFLRSGVQKAVSQNVLVHALHVVERRGNITGHKVDGLRIGVDGGVDGDVSGVLHDDEQVEREREFLKRFID